MQKQPLTKSTAWQLAPGLHMRQFGLDQGIYNPETKQIHLLNPTAGLILNYLFAGKSPDEIVENIVIACGKNTAKPEQIRKDLDKTVKELERLRIVTAARSSGKESKEMVIITEHEMTSLSIPYLVPDMKTYHMEDLLKKYGKTPGNVSFCDTWTPVARDVNFLDTWTPDPKVIRQTPKTIPGLNTKGLSGKK